MCGLCSLKDKRIRRARCRVNRPAVTMVRCLVQDNPVYGDSGYCYTVRVFRGETILYKDVVGARNMKKRIAALILALIGIFLFSVSVYAAVGDITYLNGDPSTTSIQLAWIKASGSTNTIVRYRTNTYPSTYSDGTSAYSGTANETTLTGLTSGQVYYFAAWGYDGVSEYSAASYTWVCSTLSATIPSGDSETSTLGINVPTVPAEATQNPDESSFNLEPFTSILNYFNSGDGGLGMPTSNMWETLYLLLIVISGLITYIKTKTFFIAFFVVFLMSCFGVGLHLVQAYLVAIEIVVAAGIWAIERYAQ
jgi:hypothetical protein